ncbi:MAG: hypothetical protein B6D41_18710 [Chloroflexi bacterium UTCFX4]|jgi:hypothetical protein|nr:MAG: hypothetical protein B6D41_18710 [Chloroflexi bacterium UTCFX4]
MILAIVLTKFMHAKKRSLGKLAELTQELDARAEKQNVEVKLRGVAKRTLANWRNGIVKHPRLWEELVLVAAALELDAAQTDELLHAARHQPLAELRAREPRADRLALLARWEADAPFQVGPDLNYFAGRKMEAAKLQDALLKQRAVTICGLRGMGGVGKTTLARHLAYRLRNQFPDGVLWGQLNRSDTMSILASFAREYKLDVSEFHDVESRSRAVQSFLANKRVLIILDNAQTSEQVRPLLPPSTGKPAIIITTRHDLAVSDEMLAFELRPFASDGQEALELCTNILGEQTARRQRGALLELAALLGYLPLALAIAANRLRQTPVGAKRERAVNEFLERVRGEIAHVESARLDELTRENLSVRVTFDQSFAELTDAQKNFFIALGAFGGNDFDAAAAAFVAQVSEENASAHLNALEKLSLAQETQAGRFTLHELVRDFAREKLVGTDAYARMCEYYFQLVEKLPSENYSLLMSDLSNIEVALERAQTLQLNDLAHHGALVCSKFLLARGRYDLAERACQFALDTCAAEPSIQRLVLLNTLGGISYWAGNLSQGQAYYQSGLALARELNQPRDICDAVIGCAITNPRPNRDETIALYKNTLEIAKEIEYGRAILTLLNNLGYFHMLTNIGHAIFYYREALNEAVRQNNEWMRLLILANLGVAIFEHGEWQLSETYWKELETASFASDSEIHQIMFRSGYGKMELARGNLERAQSLFQKNLEYARRVRRQSLEVEMLAGLGEIAWRKQEIKLANANFEQAQSLVQGVRPEDELELQWRLGNFYLNQASISNAEKAFGRVNALSDELGFEIWCAYAIFGLAQGMEQRGNLLNAERLGVEALTRFEKMEHYRAAEVRAWLEQLPA